MNVGRWLSEAWVAAKRLRLYVVVASIVLLVGGLYGYYDSGALHNLLLTQLKQLQEKAKTISDHHDVLYTMWQIFANNLKASLMTIVLGLFFGVFPLYMIFSNGALVGFMLLLLHSKESLSPWELLVVGILPHGIFELAAFVLASAAGMRIGTSILVKSPGLSRGRSFAHAWRQAAVLLAIVVPLLFVAAIVESTVTPVLLNSIIPAHPHGGTI